MRITMVGTGYVGLVTGTCLANTGNDVTCLDVVQAKIDKLNAGVSPIYEPGLDELIQRNAKAGRLNFTLDKAAAYGDAEIIFICVGTPSDDKGRADLKYVLAAASDIGDAIEAGPADATPKVVVVKSTVPVGTNAKVQAAIAAKTSKSFHMASNPEFLKEGAAINDFNKPDRVVIGAATEFASDVMHKLYEPFVRQGHPIYVMDIPSAEMVKYAANAMLATKISFINEIANLCEAYGADVDRVRLGMCADKRIGNQFLYPGLGYGGSCFPKDVLACMSMGEDVGTKTAVLNAVHFVNQQQRKAFWQKVVDFFGGKGTGGLTGKTIGVWGIAFKPGTDDIREAPAISLMERLIDSGASVKAYDPVAHETCQDKLGDRVTYCPEPYAAAEQADALVICTDWDEFKAPDLQRLKTIMNAPVIFDGRNILRNEDLAAAGFTYHSVGRAPVVQEPAAAMA
ncbi:MAG: UDP-glucose/GDP-mannose dehydrogenase family protein [Planctomycetota bacterium]